MRLKNIKGAKEKISKSPYIILNPKDYKGKYKTIFNNIVFLNLVSTRFSNLVSTGFVNLTPPIFDYKQKLPNSHPLRKLVSLI